LISPVGNTVVGYLTAYIEAEWQYCNFLGTVLPGAVCFHHDPSSCSAPQGRYRAVAKLRISKR
jgi:hypothetical protein